MAKAPEPKLTYEDYARFPDDGRRWELIDGEAFVTPSPKTRHQDVVLRLVRLIADHLDEQGGGGRVFVAPYDVVLSEHDLVQPDIVFVSASRERLITDLNIQGTPDWLIEVLSDPVHDRRRKLQLYARAGVPEYWIVDPDADLVEMYLLADGRYGEPEIHRPPSSVGPRTLPRLGVALDRLFAR